MGPGRVGLAIRLALVAGEHEVGGHVYQPGAHCGRGLGRVLGRQGVATVGVVVVGLAAVYVGGGGAVDYQAGP